MLDRSASVWYNHTRVGEHIATFQRVSQKFMSAVDEKSKRRSSINTNFDSEVEIKGLENREIYSKPVKSIHQCMTDIIRASTTVSLFEDIVWMANHTYTREDPKFPQRRGLIRSFGIWESLPK